MKTKINEVQNTIGPIITSIQHHPELVIKPIMIIFSVAITVSMVVAILEIWHDWMLRKRGTLLEVLPKETTTIKETEKLIKNLHSMLLTTKWRKLIYGRPYVSFEIMATEGRMKFYLWVPGEIKERVVDRIYATYPDIAIKNAEKDYLPEKLNKKIYSYGAEMELGYNFMLKIKTKADSDIIPSILSGMRDLGRNEINIVQVIIRPRDNKWQIEGRKALGEFERTGRRPGNGFGFSGVREAISKAAIEVKDEFGKGGGEFISFGGESLNRKTRLERKEITGASEKLFESGFETVIRIGAIGSFRKGNKIRVKSIAAAFNELDQDNRFKKSYIPSQALLFEHLKKRKMHPDNKKNILTTSELSNFFLRMPGSDTIDQFPDIETLKTKEFSAPKNVETRFNILAKNAYRGEDTPIGIKDLDWVRMMVIQGAIGTGKSEWCKTLFLQTISNIKDEFGNIIRPGRGAMVLEPTGKLAGELLEIIPEDRRKDVIVFDMFSDNPLPFNFCKVIKRKESELTIEQQGQKTVDEAIEIFKRRFNDVWSDKNGAFIKNLIKTIIDIEEGTMVEMPRLLNDAKFRKSAVRKIKDPKLKQFWTTYFTENPRTGQLDPGTESTAKSVEYKLEEFLSSKEMLRAVGQDDCIDFKDILDNNKIIIFKLSKDKMSKDRVSFIGSIALKLLGVAAYSRDRKMWNTPFPVFLDEAQNFVDESIKDITYELRKFGIALVLMHQELEQLDEVPGLKNAIYNNFGTFITFRTGDIDAPFFEKKYGPRVDQRDLVNLPSRHGYCKLMVDGKISDTFNIYSLDSPKVTPEVAAESVKEIIEVNRSYKGKKLKNTAELDEMLKDRITGYIDITKNDAGEDIPSHVLKFDTEADEGPDDINEQKISLAKNFDNSESADAKKSEKLILTKDTETNKEPENEFFKMIEEQKNEITIDATSGANNAGEDLWARAADIEKEEKVKWRE